MERGEIAALDPDDDGRGVVDLPGDRGPSASRAATVSHSSAPIFRPTLYLSIASISDVLTASVYSSFGSRSRRRRRRRPPPARRRSPRRVGARTVPRRRDRLGRACWRGPAAAALLHRGASSRIAKSRAGPGGWVLIVVLELRARVLLRSAARRPEHALLHHRHVDVEEHAVALRDRSRGRGRCR